MIIIIFFFFIYIKVVVGHAFEKNYWYRLDSWRLLGEKWFTCPSVLHAKQSSIQQLNNALKFVKKIRLIMPWGVFHVKCFDQCFSLGKFYKLLKSCASDWLRANLSVKNTDKTLDEMPP